MSRALLVVLIIADVFACPLNCAVRANVCAPGHPSAKQGCACCRSALKRCPTENHKDRAPSEQQGEGESCPCFCNGDFTFAVTRPTIDFDLVTPLWMTCFEPLLDLSRILTPAEFHAPPNSTRASSGLGLRIDIQSFLL